jgi:peptidoglycan-associated lipoprotein
MSRNSIVSLILAVSVGGMLGAGCKPPPPAPPPPPPPVENFQKAFFELDGSGLRLDAKSAVDGNVAIMNNHSSMKIEVQGHADERGTTQYNMALGQRRANSIVRYMSANGISEARLRAVSYGEERPTLMGGGEAVWDANRRGEFKITYGGTDYTRGTTSN